MAFDKKPIVLSIIIQLLSIGLSIAICVIVAQGAYGGRGRMAGRASFATHACHCSQAQPHACTVIESRSIRGVPMVPWLEEVLLASPVPTMPSMPPAGHLTWTLPGIPSLAFPYLRGGKGREGSLMLSEQLLIFILQHYAPPLQSSGGPGRGTSLPTQNGTRRATPSMLTKTSVS
jgi:hypothetical protein